MRILLAYCFDHSSARRIYGHIARSLRRRRMAVDLVRDVRERDVSRYDVIVSHDFLDPQVRALPTLRCYGGRSTTRPDGLTLVEQCGIPVVPWALAQDHDEVRDLFDRWQADRVLRKRSGTWKGKGVCAFDRNSLERLSWNPKEDIFCPDANARDGNVYKVEMFNGRVIISWVALRPPLSQGFEGFVPEIPGGWPTRRLFRAPGALRESISGLSAALTRQGLGYCGVDLMRTPRGELVAIELNTGRVATWWTARFRRVRWRYERAVRTLIQDPESATP